jgi:hypothetical protein
MLLRNHCFMKKDRCVVSSHEISCNPHTYEEACLHSPDLECVPAIPA